MEIKKLKKDYMAGLKYKEIQKKYNITKSQLVYLIRKNNWKRQDTRSKALEDNQNAKGNRGGPGAKQNNKRALKTGEYENIFSSVFSEEEQEIFENYKIENKKQVLLEELKILTIRERRMLHRIQDIQDKNKDMTISSMSKTNSSYGKKNNTTTVTQAESTTTTIQKIEEALTRIQESKRRCIESLSKVGLDTERLNIERERLKIEQKKLEIEIQNMNSEEIEDLSETDADIYGKECKEEENN